MNRSSDTSAADSPFGLYRAEWLNHAIFQLFTKPTYYPELETARPCVLVGGRGTGKTTVLRCLSYDGKFELEGSDPAKVLGWRYFGVYHRIDTNRVTAFRGEELSGKQWDRAFAHYINLLLCSQILKFLQWYYETFPKHEELDAQSCSDIADTLYLDGCKTRLSLTRATDKARKSFEGFLNNVDPDEMPSLSVQGQPIDELCSALLRLPQFVGKSFFFIIDEYENLLDYQQVILNTLIKHCGAYYTFKIGIRELGWRKRSTSNENEQLISPADYEKIDIAERLSGENFATFAAEVCNLRARHAPSFASSSDIPVLFPNLSIENEATLLGVEEHLPRIRARAEAEGISWAELADLSPLELFFVDYWADNESSSLKSVLEERSRNQYSWNNRFNNYKFAILFLIREGKTGIKKYYCGWRTYIGLANGNIRYLLELIVQAVNLNQRSDGKPGQPISPEIQTRAAEAVGRKNLAELEGLSVQGAQLTKLLLGLGRVFEVLAHNPRRHAPEITQFHIPDDVPLNKAEPLLTAAVMHLALVRDVSSKRSHGTSFDLKSYDYAIHPIFSPFFVFSNRRKRKMKLTPHQLISLVEDPRTAIRQILRQHNHEDDVPLPEQLQLFANFYR